MKLTVIATGAALLASLVGGIGAQAPHADLDAAKSVAASTSKEGFAIVGPDGATRTVAADDNGGSGLRGLSVTIHMEPTDHIVLSADARSFSLQDHDGGVLLSSSSPTVQEGDEAVPAKFVVDGEHLYIAPITDAPAHIESECPSSFWGNLIFNIGMAGVCAMLGIPTAGAATVACSMAVIGANLGINWDSHC